MTTRDPITVAVEVTDEVLSVQLAGGRIITAAIDYVPAPGAHQAPSNIPEVDVGHLSNHPGG